MKIVIGTSPVHIFTIPLKKDAVKEVEITYHQEGKEIINKKTADCVITDNSVSATLTQEETFLFNSDLIVEVQLRVLSYGNEPFVSDIFTVRCVKCLFSEVLK